MSRGSILKNTFTVGAFTALSRVLGLVREMLQSRLVGAGVAQSAFTLAFALPNMARKLFGEGALTAAFVPVFKGEVERGSLEAASRLARAVMTTMFLMLFAAALLGFGALECVARSGEALKVEDPGRFELTLSLVKTLLPYMVFICGAAFAMGAVNSLGRFKASGFAPCILNICWIAALSGMFFFPELSPESRVRYVAFAILAAGALQLAFMMWVMARAGVSPMPTLSGWFDAGVRKVWRNVAIAALGAGAVQVNYMLDQILAQMASPWAAGVIGYAERLMDLPLGVIGVAFGTVLLPTFAGLFAKGDADGARVALSSSFVSLVFVMAPAAAGLAVLSREVTEVIYQGGEFDAVATVRVARALAVYSAGLCLFGFQKVMVPWFQAQNDMKTPLRVSVATVFVNAALNVSAVVFLPVEWRHVGLAASTVACAALGCAMLFVAARRKNGRLGLSRTVRPLALVFAASAAMGGALLLLRPAADALAMRFGDRVGPIVRLAALIASGMAVYGAIALVAMREQLRALLRRRRRVIG